jgi:hypothetical protein
LFLRMCLSPSSKPKCRSIAQSVRRYGPFVEPAIGSYSGRISLCPDLEQLTKKRFEKWRAQNYESNTHTQTMYCDITPESRNSEVRIVVHCYVTTRQTYSRGNEYTSNIRVTSVAMERRCKHAFPTIGRLCFLRGPCKVVIKEAFS